MASLKPIAVTSATLTLDRHIHAGTTTLLSRAAGVTVTLPAATGSGDVYTVVVQTAVTSNNDIVKVANSTDVMQGWVSTATVTTGAGTHEAIGGTDDTITMNGTTSGGLAGSLISLQDVAAGFWQVEAFLAGSGTLITPLSASV